MSPLVDTHDTDGRPRKASEILIELGRKHHLFHDEGGDGYARVKNDYHFEVFAISSSAYRDYLSRDYYRLTRKGAGRNALLDAISTLMAIAKNDGPQEAVWLRSGLSPAGFVLDAGTDDWRSIQITAKGWKLSSDRIVNFRRSGKATPLPVPSKADFSKIWKYVNVDESDRPLIAGWILGALRPTGPYPILLLTGEQGTGKSGASRTLKRLTDPSAVLLRSPPSDEKDLLVAAFSSWVLALDNLSGAKPELCDALCRISTGGGLAGRTLYTNTDETLIEVKRPVILNGIDDIASRPDLAERCIHIELPLLGSSKRVTEATLDSDFLADSREIFSSILDGLVMAQRDHNITRGALPRMADFAQWAAAGVPAIGYSAELFLDAYRSNQDGAIEAGLESSALASTLIKLIARLGTWSGSPSSLLAELNHENCSGASFSSWPRTSSALVRSLRRLAPSLRHVGVEYSKTRSATTRSLTFTHKAYRQASQVSLSHDQ